MLRAIFLIEHIAHGMIEIPSWEKRLRNLASNISKIISRRLDIQNALPQTRFK